MEDDEKKGGKSIGSLYPRFRTGRVSFGNARHAADAIHPTTLAPSLIGIGRLGSI